MSEHNSSVAASDEYSIEKPASVWTTWVIGCGVFACMATVGCIGVVLTTHFLLKDENRPPRVPTPSMTAEPTRAPMESLSPVARNTPHPTFGFDQCPSLTTDPCCNGLGNICDLRVNEVLFGVVHNAGASKEDNIFGSRHMYSAEDAVAAGYRGVHFQLCNCDGTLAFCNGSCDLGFRDAADVLKEIYDFLIENVREIMVIILDVNNRNDQPAVDLNDLYDDLDDISGFTDMIYLHGNNNWPILASLVANNRRMIFFHRGGPTCAEALECPAGFNYYYDYVVDTPINFKDTSEIQDSFVSCRMAEGNATTASFFGVYHFLSVPDEQNSKVLNDYRFLKGRVDACSRENENRAVNFVYVDHWDIGDVVEVVQLHNGIEV